jgi:hypothetical protein
MVFDEMKYRYNKPKIGIKIYRCKNMFAQLMFNISCQNNKFLKKKGMAALV